MMSVPKDLKSMAGATLNVWPGETYHVPTKRFKLGTQILGESGTFFSSLLGKGPLLLLQDDTTRAIAGIEVTKSLEAAGIDVKPLTLSPKKGYSRVKATDTRVSEVQAALDGCTGAIAVGAGTVNDLVKRATHLVGIPYGVVCTAASMNGYTSAIAAISVKGIKRTLPCTPPLGLLADLGIVAAAPPALAQSGLGDLLSKPVSSGDWRMAHFLHGEPFSEVPLQIVEAAFEKVQASAVGIGKGDPDAIGHLLEALILSGISMASAGSSSPASGGEHLISHYWDMVAPYRNREVGLHGAQVGVTTLISATLFQKLQAIHLDDAFIQNRLDAYIPMDQYLQGLKMSPEPIREAMAQEVASKYPSKKELEARLRQLQEGWASLWNKLSPGLQKPEQLRSVLQQADAPTTAKELGIAPWEVEEAFLRARDIRARYTVLDLAFDLGVLEALRDEVLGEAEVI